MIQITYQKRSGDIIQRIINTYTPYKIGETTRQGWKVIDKKYSYKGKFYSMSDYDIILNKDVKRDKIIIGLKRNVYKLYKEAAYFLILIILYRIIEILFLKS